MIVILTVFSFLHFLCLCFLSFLFMIQIQIEKSKLEEDIVIELL